MESIANSLSKDFALQGLNQDLLAPAKQKDNQEKAPGDILQNFGDMLKNHMNNLNDLSNQAEKSVETYAAGGPVELHSVMISLEKANTALQLSVQVRNKLITAYQDLMHMQI